MNKHILIILLLITCTLRTYAGDSITISAADLQSLVERIERLERREIIEHKIAVAFRNAAAIHSKTIQQSTRYCL